LFVSDEIDDVLDGWLAELLVDDDGWLDDALVEAELEGWLFAALEDDDGWFIEDEALVEADAEPDRPEVEDAKRSSPGMSALACFACRIAACVRGPMTPST
jgi:hypothetical protein